jgi:hypothetical protein
MIERVTLYRAPTTVADVDAIADWIGARVDATVEVRERFLSLYGGDDLAEGFAEARVLSPYERETGNTMLGIVRYEERALEPLSVPAASSTTACRSSDCWASDCPTPNSRSPISTFPSWIVWSAPGATTTGGGTSA